MEASEGVQIWRRSDGAELQSVTDYTGTMAVYEPSGHYVGVFTYLEMMDVGYALVDEHTDGE